MSTIGWREWVSLPQLNIPQVKAKIDTGARTSALHAFELECFTDNGIPRVRFLIHPFQKRTKSIIECVTDLKEMRHITDSGGHREERPVIETIINIGDLQWPIEITLTSRDDMRFRMLLARTALRSQHLMIDPSASYLIGKRVK